MTKSYILKKHHLTVITLMLLLSVMSFNCAGTKTTAKTKKLKLITTSLFIHEGDRVALKYKVKPKKAKIKFLSSNKRIANVTKKGIVKGKSVGNVKITIKSGKKKRKAKVRVDKTYSMKSIEFVNNKVINVRLACKKILNASQFNVDVMHENDAYFSDMLKISKVNTSDFQNYEVVLAYANAENTIKDKDMVRVTVNALNGIKTKELRYYEDCVGTDENIGMEKGDSLDKTVYFSQSYVGVAYDIKIVGKLPKGLSYNVVQDGVRIKGIPAVTARGTKVTMTGRDATGKDLSRNIYFYIGSDDEIVVYTDKFGRDFLVNDDVEESYEIYVFGGSGECSVTLNENPNEDFIYYSKKDRCIRIKAEKDGKRPEAGQYSIGYLVEDDAGNKTHGILKLNAINGISISGKIAGAEGNSTIIEMQYPDIYHEMYGQGRFLADVEDDGSYNIIVRPDERYIISVYEKDTQECIKYDNYFVVKYTDISGKDFA